MVETDCFWQARLKKSVNSKIPTVHAVQKGYETYARIERYFYDRVRVIKVIFLHYKNNKKLRNRLLHWNSLWRGFCRNWILRHFSHFSFQSLFQESPISGRSVGIQERIIFCIPIRPYTNSPSHKTLTVKAYVMHNKLLKLHKHNIRLDWLKSTSYFQRI